MTSTHNSGLTAENIRSKATEPITDQTAALETKLARVRELLVRELAAAPQRERCMPDLQLPGRGCSTPASRPRTAS